MNGARVNVREEEINCEFRLNRSHLRKHRETRHWPTYLTNFFGHRRIMFSHASVQTAVNRARRVEISPGASLFANCLLPIGIAIRTNQSHRPGSCGSDFRSSVRFFTKFALRRTISRYFENMTAWFAHVFLFFPPAGVSLERVKKVIVCFARRVLHRAFPDPEMSAFLTVIIPQRVVSEFSHLMWIRHVGYMSELQVARGTNGCIVWLFYICK